MPDNRYRQTEPLARSHKVTDFNCGEPELDLYLKRFAFNNQRKEISRTYVTVRDENVVGYYTIAFGSVSPDDSADEIKAGLPKYDIPVMLLARLAVDNGEKANGLGRALLRDAMLRTVQAANIAGLRAFLVHAKHAAARRYYEQFGFINSPTNELHLMLSIKDIRENLI